MNLDELRSVQAKERRKDSLQHLRNAFYDDVAAYVADLRAARDRRAERVDNPFSDDDVRRMSDEIETAEEVAEALYERRVGKVVKLASFAAADMPVETEGMTTQERALFDDLVSRIGDNKSAVLDQLSGGSSSRGTTGSADAIEGPPDVADDAVDAVDSAGSADGALANAMGGTEDPSDLDPEGSNTAIPTDDGRNSDRVTGTESTGGPTRVEPEPAPPGAVEGGGIPVTDDKEDIEDGGENVTEDGENVTEDGEDVTEVGADLAEDGEDVADDRSGRPDEPPSMSDTDRTTVRITRDVGAILGVDDREYDLESEDVVTLPAENAEPLVRRDAAERLD